MYVVFIHFQLNFETLGHIVNLEMELIRMGISKSIDIETRVSPYSGIKT